MFINLRATIEAHLVEKSLDFRNESLLDKILSSAHVDKKIVYVTNLVKCSGPTTPAKAFATNATTCFHTHLRQEIDLVKPKAIVAFGSTVPKIMFGDKQARAGVSKYTMPDGVPFSVTHSMEELYRHGKTYFEDCVSTIKDAAKCLKP